MPNTKSMYGCKNTFGAKMMGTPLRIYVMCLMRPSEEKILDRTSEDKQLQTENKHHSGRLTLPISCYPPCSMSGETGCYSDGSRVKKKTKKL